MVNTLLCISRRSCIGSKLLGELPFDVERLRRLSLATQIIMLTQTDNVRSIILGLRSIQPKVIDSERK